MNRGDLYWINLDPTQGSEIRKKRPCVIISATPINKARRTVVIIPLTSKTKAFPPITIPIKCLNKTGVAVCDQIRAVDKNRLIKQIGSIDEKELRQLEASLGQILAINQLS
jgi:mRNA interferase MazF